MPISSASLAVKNEGYTDLKKGMATKETPIIITPTITGSFLPTVSSTTPTKGAIIMVNNYV